MIQRIEKPYGIFTTDLLLHNPQVQKYTEGNLLRKNSPYIAPNATESHRSTKLCYLYVNRLENLLSQITISDFAKNFSSSFDMKFYMQRNSIKNNGKM